MNDTEKNDEKNAGDQEENANEPAARELYRRPDHRCRQSCARADVGAPACALEFDCVSYLDHAPACGVQLTHDRHVAGPISNPIHCGGFVAPEDDVPTYAKTIQDWLEANSWAKTYATLVHHAQVLARKLDKAGDDAPAATSSAYLQAISRLERMRPGASQAGDDGDGLTPPGQQPSLFDPIGD